MGGTGRYVSRLSLDTSVDISAKYRSTIDRVSIKYRSTVDRVPIMHRSICGQSSVNT